MRWGMAGNPGLGFSDAHRRFVGTRRGQGVEDIDDCEDARANRNLVANQTFRITAASVRLVMVEHHLREPCRSAIDFEDARSDDRMTLHLQPLILRKRAILMENGIADPR